VLLCVAPEGFTASAVVAALNIIGLYHDSIVKEAADRLPDHKKPKLSAHARYTTYWLQNSKSYSVCARILTIIGYSELVIEMVARKKLSRDRKWRLIIALEATKWVQRVSVHGADRGTRAALRLFILQATNFRPLVEPIVPQREVDPSTIEHKAGSKQKVTGPHPDLAWTGARTALLHPTLHSIRPEHVNGNADLFGDVYIDEFLRKSRYMPTDVKSPAHLITPLQGVLERWNEVIWILRPLIYGKSLRISPG
jgi:peroxin-16